MRNEIAQWVLPHLRERDLLFITLTSPHRVTKDDLSRAVAKLIHRVKRRVLGRKGEHQNLATFVVLEPSPYFSSHAHLILENPYSKAAKQDRSTSIPIGELIAAEWGKLRLGGRSVAQDVRPVYDLPGLFQYLQKSLGGTGVLDRLDINNLHLPPPHITPKHVPLGAG